MEYPHGRHNVILPLLFVLVPLSSAFSAIVDGATKVRDFHGQWSWVTTSNYSSIFTSVFVYLIVGISVATIAKDLLSSKRSFSIPYLVAAVPLLLAGLYFLRSDYSTALNVLITVVVMLAVGILGIDRRDIRLLAQLAIGTGITSILFSLLNPQRAIAPCRIDKCSVLNGLLTSFFPQENVLAIFMIIGLVVVMFGLQGPSRSIGAIMLICLLSLSGSRTVTVAAVIIAVLSLAIIHVKNDRRQAWIRGFSATIAGALFIVSAALFFIPLDSLALTGRGFIYALLRDYWVLNPLIGPGRSVLDHAFSIGMSANYAISHEHGGMPYIIVNGGLLGLSFFAYWLFMLLRTNICRPASWESGLCLVFAVTVAIVSLTEPVWTYDLRSPAFWTLAFVSCTLIPHNAPTGISRQINIVRERRQ